MRKWVIMLLLMLLPSFAQAAVLEKGPVSIEGYVENESSVYPNFSKWIKNMNILDLEAQCKPNPWFSFYAHIHKYWDFAYNQENEYAPARHAMYTNRKTWQGISWLRELYVDFFSDYLDIRAGKQLITWGTADGVRVLDAYINPLDWREFVLKPWNEIKVPLWTLKMEFQPTLNGSLQFLFIPDFEPDYYAPYGSPFAFRVTKQAHEQYQEWRQSGYHVDIYEERPAQNISNAKYGVRWRNVLGGFEYTLNYLYGWDTTPETYITVDTSTATDADAPPSLPPGVPPIGSTFIVTKRYSRINVWGGTFSKTFVNGPSFLKGLTLRGEFAYVRNKPTPYLGKDKMIHYEKINNFNYVIGLDKWIISNWLASFQFIQFINSKKDVSGQPFIGPAGGVVDKVETILTLKVSTDFFHERLKPDLLIVYGDDNDWRISPSFTFEWGDHITTTLGAHILEGKATTLNGEFKHSKEIYLNVKYSF